MTTCGTCGVTITRRELTAEEADRRDGRTVIWVDSVGAAKETGLRGHYHEPAPQEALDNAAIAEEARRLNRGG